MESEARNERGLALRWGLWLGIWSVPGLMQGIQELTYAEALDQPARLAHIALHFVPSWWPWAAFTPLVLELARRFPVQGRRWVRALAVHVPACLVLGGVHLLLLGYVRTTFPPADWAERNFGNWMIRALWSLHAQAEVLAYAGVLLGGQAARSLRTSRERELRAARLETQLGAARLDALRSQLQPHFLFNTLNTIDVLVEVEPATARRMILRLSELLRRTLEVAGSEHRLADELEHVACYLGIERERFSDRLEVIVEVPEELVEQTVPSLVLQPLVENALRHGIAPRAEGGCIRIVAEVIDEQLELRVEDDGVGWAASTSEGIGLGNTRSRLRELYGGRAELRREARPGGGAVVRVRLPRAPGGDEPSEELEPA